MNKQDGEHINKHQNERGNKKTLQSKKTNKPVVCEKVLSTRHIYCSTLQQPL